MTVHPPGEHLTGAARAADPAALERFFGAPDGVLPLWIAEPYVPLAPGVVAALQERAATGWYGYEVRPPSAAGAFWDWARRRHGWGPGGLQTTVSPSVGTSIGVLIDRLTDPGDGVILQPPVFTDFKPLVKAAGREVVRNPLVREGGRYRMDLGGLAAAAAGARTRMLILCNPHNPVGRVWSEAELRAAAEVCAEHDVMVLADEVHGDLALPPHRCTPFARAAAGTGARWAAVWGPIKTFGLAGVCDTLLITDDDALTATFREASGRFHLTRTNVFGVAALEAGYRTGGPWLDGLLDLVTANAALLRDGLPDGIGLVEPEGTYLAWLDFRDLGMDVPGLASWLGGAARLALSPGHWFGREGAGFARMTIAAPTDRIEEAVTRLRTAVGAR
ncbi:MAG: aminotransferase class I/II-fold pyridoxal phosphate-dependent enzyme [Actinobacteria bacterium]|nr:aminotransferase class I/II-fold pyridoxal phosphate-dependent enzyme [Actinomycetota bacterium]